MSRNESVHKWQIRFALSVTVVVLQFATHAAAVEVESSSSVNPGGVTVGAGGALGTELTKRYQTARIVNVKTSQNSILKSFPKMEVAHITPTFADSKFFGLRFDTVGNPGSFATLGLKSGDILLAVDQQPIPPQPPQGNEEFLKFGPDGAVIFLGLTAKPPGQLELLVQRKGRYIRIRATITGSEQEKTNSAKTGSKQNEPAATGSAE